MAQVAVLQICSSAGIQDNLQSLAPWFAEAKEAGAQLLLLPENFASMSHYDTDKLSFAECEGDGPIQSHVSQLAQDYGLWIIAGSLPLKHSAKQVKSSCLVYDEQGKQVARYDKIHRFDVRVSKDEAYQESLTVERGDAIVVVDTPVGRVGLSICYDLRFAELYRELQLKGAEVFAVPSAFTALTGKAHWEILLRARAIENVAYVIAANQAGLHANGRSTYGHSMIIDPWGSVLCEQAKGRGLIMADINLQYLQERRRQFPCLEHHIL